jgi:hypothetical protein
VRAELVGVGVVAALADEEGLLGVAQGAAGLDHPRRAQQLPGDIRGQGRVGGRVDEVLVDIEVVGDDGVGRHGLGVGRGHALAGQVGHRAVGRGVGEHVQRRLAGLDGRVGAGGVIAHPDDRACRGQDQRRGAVADQASCEPAIEISGGRSGGRGAVVDPTHEAVVVLDRRMRMPCHWFCWSSWDIRFIGRRSGRLV